MKLLFVTYVVRYNAPSVCMCRQGYSTGFVCVCQLFKTLTTT